MLWAWNFSWEQRRMSGKPLLPRHRDTITASEWGLIKTIEKQKGEKIKQSTPKLWDNIKGFDICKICNAKRRRERTE